MSDDGDPLRAGQVNTSHSTTIRSAGTDATLTLGNDQGPALRLVPGPVTSNFPGPGTLATNHVGLHIRHGLPSAVSGESVNVLSSGNAYMPVPTPPTRVLDTRNAAGRARLVDGRGDIDSAGRAVGGAFLVVDLGGLVRDAQGLFATVTVTQTVGGGYATVWGTGEWPRTSTINWWGRGQVLSNGVLSECGWYEANGTVYNDIVAIQVSSPAAIVLDVTGFLVADPSSVAGATVGRRQATAAPGSDGARAAASTTNNARQPERRLVRP